MKPLPPIFTLDLFPLLETELIELLQSLTEQDWERPTIASQWKVKDVAAHLLDGNLRSLSMLRDGYFGEKPDNIQSYEDLVGFLNQLNATWVTAMKRISPGVLIALLETSGKQYIEMLKTLKPFEKATFSVAWAGEQESYNWFHIAREYTEKWHHQQQIRLAVGQEQRLYNKVFYFPYLDTSMRALPHHYRTVLANEGTLIKIQVTGEGGGEWFLYRNAQQWTLVEDCDLRPACEIKIDGEIAWRMFTKGIARQTAENQVVISGDLGLGSKIFGMLAVMA